MTDHPMLFSGPMVKAILEDKKTQIRRVIKPQPPPKSVWNTFSHLFTIPGSRLGVMRHCPYGQHGDRLWAKETHYLYGRWIGPGITKTGKQAWKFQATTDEVRYLDDIPRRLHPHLSREVIARERLSDWVKRPSIFMYRWASRITLEIVSVRVERLQEISNRDAIAEGVVRDGIGLAYWKNYRSEGCLSGTATSSFVTLWDSINGKKHPWESNPWVWVYEFKRVT